MTLGIIGTAFRGTDAKFRTVEVWNEVKRIAGRFIRKYDIPDLVSGGAAGMDHIAVQAYNAGFVKNLYLFLPCPFISAYVDTGIRGPKNPGQTSNHYHRLFSEAVGINSFWEIETAIKNGAFVKQDNVGFHARNTDVARSSGILLAFTVGDGPKLKDGGTADTMKKFLTTHSQGDAWHVDLNTMKLYQGAEV